MNEIGFPVTTSLILFGFLFLIVLLLREVFCWYFKINRFLSVFNEFNDNFKVLSKEFSHYLKIQRRILKTQHNSELEKFEKEIDFNNADGVIETQDNEFIDVQQIPDDPKK